MVVGWALVLWVAPPLLSPPPLEWMEAVREEEEEQSSGTELVGRGVLYLGHKIRILRLCVVCGHVVSVPQSLCCVW